MSRVSKENKLKSATLLVRQAGECQYMLCDACVCQRYSRSLRRYQCCGVAAKVAGKTSSSVSYCLDYATRWLMAHGHADVILNNVL